MLLDEPQASAPQEAPHLRRRSRIRESLVGYASSSKRLWSPFLRRSLFQDVRQANW